MVNLTKEWSVTVGMNPFFIETEQGSGLDVAAPYYDGDYTARIYDISTGTQQYDIQPNTGVKVESAAYGFGADQDHFAVATSTGMNFYIGDDYTFKDSLSLNDTMNAMDMKNNEAYGVTEGQRLKRYTFDGTGWTQTTDISYGYYGFSVLYDPTNDYVYIANDNGGKVDVRDSTDITTTIATIPINWHPGSTVSKLGMAIDPNANYLFAPFYDGSQFGVRKIDIANWTETQRKVGITETADMVHSPSGDPATLFVHCYDSNGTMYMLDPSDLSIKNSVSAPESPFSTTIDSNGDYLAATGATNFKVQVWSISYASFSGVVTDTNSNAISGAAVYAINASDGSITGTDTTASDGSYSITAPDKSTEHHLIVQYEDGGGTKYNALSKPYVTGA